MENAKPAEYDLHWQTLHKILSQVEALVSLTPRAKPRLAVSANRHQIWKPTGRREKQRHGKRIFGVYGMNTGYTGCSIVGSGGQWCRDRAEVFVLSPPGEAQMDFIRRGGDRWGARQPRSS